MVELKFSSAEQVYISVIITLVDCSQSEDYERVSNLIFVAHGGLVHPVALHAVRSTVAPRAGHARFAHLRLDLINRFKCKYVVMK